MSEQNKDKALEHLLRSLDSEPDKAARIRALNESESAFLNEMKKNEKNRQGNGFATRLMNVTQHIHQAIGGLTMKKSYIALGSIAVGAVAVSLVGMNINQDLKATFSHVKGELASSTPQDDGRVAVEEKVIAESDAGNIEVATAAIAPPTTPSPVIYNNAPQEGSKQKAARTQNYAAGAAMDMTARSSLTFGAPDVMPQQPQYFGRDTFEEIKENPVKVAKEEPVSTFSIDVDTSSYTFVRRSLNNGILPPKDAVRVEEMINYFDYDYPVPESREEPFKPTVAVYEAPWNADTMLMHIGIKGHEMPVDAEKPHANLVFLLDVSGSMNSQDKLPLLKNAFRMLVDTLQPDDTVAIVVYAGAAGTVLEPTKVSEKGKIFSALENLSAGGSTAGGEGIRQAYNLAEAHFDKDGVNRVILATDGDFNVGITDQNQLKDLIERKRDTGIYLSVLGFGQGNYNDALMQTLAQNGNGNAAYIDTLNEARKVLVDEATSTLYPIANDVKIQVEFNPVTVAEYRLIGYETRQLKREDFNNDKVDAGDIGAGHTVTAIYEITPVGSKAQLVDDLRYGDAQEDTPKGDANEFAFLKMRYKLPGESKSQLITRPITVKDKAESIDQLSDDVRFAGAVAAFGQLLRDETYTQNFTFDDVLKLATPARGEDRFGYRSEFMNLVRLAKSAADQQAQPGGVRHPNPGVFYPNR